MDGVITQLRRKPHTQLSIKIINVKDDGSSRTTVDMDTVAAAAPTNIQHGRVSRTTSASALNTEHMRSSNNKVQLSNSGVSTSTDKATPKSTNKQGHEAALNTNCNTSLAGLDEQRNHSKVDTTAVTKKSRRKAASPELFAQWTQELETEFKGLAGSDNVAHYAARAVWTDPEHEVDDIRARYSQSTESVFALDEEL